MVRKEEIIEGRYLRTLSDFFAVPAGTLAKVDSVGTSWQGEFVFTVRWLNVNTGTQVRPISDRSLNLWEEDLAHFEAVGREEAAAATAAPLQLVRPKLTLPSGGHRRHSKSKTPNISQLSLFTSEDF
jgi:hypothetical protein